ncbi:MAG: glycosyltransferase family 2 protein, partial [Nanopusillaceae archaeon]
LEELSKFLENNKELPPSIEATLLRLKLVSNFTGNNFLNEEIFKKVDNFEWLNLKPDNYFHKNDYNPFFIDTIFIIYSCQKNLNTRIKEIRDTYIKDLKRLKIPYIIIVGGLDRDYIEDDVLYLNVPDSYEDLPKKTIKLLKWLYENTSFYYFYKIDDDSYIDIEKFLSTLQYRKCHYYGKKNKKFLQLDRTWHKGKSKNEIISLTLDKSYSNISWADGGSGYSLTRFAIYKILKTLETEYGKFLSSLYLYEDILIGTLLGINDIFCVETEYYVSKQFRTSTNALPVHKWENFFYPSKINPIVYVHLDTKKNLKKVHEIKETQKLYPYKIWSSSINVKLGYNSNQLELLSDRSKLKLLDKEPIVIVPVRNERKMLPHFLSYYRKLGVESFVFIDNLSDDGTREYLLEQPDVVVFSADTDYKASHYGICWQHAILSNFCIDKWVLLLDADEFLVYENCEEVNIKDFLNNVESMGFKGVRADLIDVYPKKLEFLDLSKNSPFEVAIFFDKEPLIPIIYGAGAYSNCEIAYSSNLRYRISTDALISDFTSVKYPIFKYYPWIRFSEGVHFVTPSENFLEGEAFLLHFKYHSDFKKKVVTEVLRKQYFENAREYIRYYIALERNKGDLYDENISLKYENSKQFIKYMRRFYKK